MKYAVAFIAYAVAFISYVVAFIAYVMIVGGLMWYLLGAIFDISERHKSFAENHEDVETVLSLKAECEEVHQTECEISVYYLPKASVPYDGE